MTIRKKAENSCGVKSVAWLVWIMIVVENRVVRGSGVAVKKGERMEWGEL